MEEINNQSSQSDRKSILKIVIVVSVVLALGLLIYVGYSYYQKSEAKKYTISAGSNFSKTIASINQLSSENRIEEDDTPTLTKKLEDEKTKGESAYLVVKNSKKDLAQFKNNTLTKEANTALEDFYKDSEEKIAEYNEYINYSIKFSENVDEVVKISVRLESLDKTCPSNDNFKVAGCLDSIKKDLDDKIGEAKSLVAPFKLKNTHDKYAIFLEKLSKLLGDLSTASRENSVAKINEATGRSTEFEGSAEKTIADLAQELKDHFNEMHKNFIGLTEKANDAKTALTKTSAKLDINLENANIERW